MMTYSTAHFGGAEYYNLPKTIQANELHVLAFINSWSKVEDSERIKTRLIEYVWVSNKLLLKQFPRLGITKEVSFKHIIKRLEDAGLIIRFKDNVSERKQFLALTQLAHNVLLYSEQHMNIIKKTNKETEKRYKEKQRKSTNKPDKIVKDTLTELSSEPVQDCQANSNRVISNRVNISSADGGGEKKAPRKKVSKDYSSTNKILELFNYYFDTTYVNTDSYHENMLYIKQNYDMETIKDTLKAVSKEFNKDQSNPYYTFLPGVFQKHAMEHKTSKKPEFKDATIL